MSADRRVPMVSGGFAKKSCWSRTFPAIDDNEKTGWWGAEPGSLGLSERVFFSEFPVPFYRVATKVSTSLADM